MPITPYLQEHDTERCVPVHQISGPQIKLICETEMENTNEMPRHLRLSACVWTGVIRFVRGNANAAARNSPRIVARRRKMNGRKKFYIHERERERKRGRKKHKQRDASPMEQFATTKTALRKGKKWRGESKKERKKCGLEWRWLPSYALQIAPRRCRRCSLTYRPKCEQAYVPKVV